MNRNLIIELVNKHNDNNGVKTIENKTYNLLTLQQIEKIIADYVSNQVQGGGMQKYTDTWQLCPKCNGQGIMSKPSYVQGDVQQWSSSSAIHICDVCNGTKIIKR